MHDPKSRNVLVSEKKSDNVIKTAFDTGIKILIHCDKKYKIINEEVPVKQTLKDGNCECGCESDIPVSIKHLVDTNGEIIMTFTRY